MTHSDELSCLEGEIVLKLPELAKLAAPSFGKPEHVIIHLFDFPAEILVEQATTLSGDPIPHRNRTRATVTPALLARLAGRLGIDAVRLRRWIELGDHSVDSGRNLE